MLEFRHARLDHTPPISRESKQARALPFFSSCLAPTKTHKERRLRKKMKIDSQNWKAAAGYVSESCALTALGQHRNGNIEYSPQRTKS